MLLIQTFSKLHRLFLVSARLKSFKPQVLVLPRHETSQRFLALNFFKPSCYLLDYKPACYFSCLIHFFRRSLMMLLNTVALVILRIFYVLYFLSRRKRKAEKFKAIPNRSAVFYWPRHNSLHFSYSYHLAA